MKKLHIVLPFVFSAAVSIQAAYAGPDNWEFGMDRPGGDIGSFIQPIIDPKLCENHCTGVPTCKAWALRISDRRCFLKSTFPIPSINNNVISGVVGR